MISAADNDDNNPNNPRGAHPEIIFKGNKKQKNILMSHFKKNPELLTKAKDVEFKVGNSGKHVMETKVEIDDYDDNKRKVSIVMSPEFFQKPYSSGIVAHELHHAEEFKTLPVKQLEREEQLKQNYNNKYKNTFHEGEYLKIPQEKRAYAFEKLYEDKDGDGFIAAADNDDNNPNNPSGAHFGERYKFPKWLLNQAKSEEEKNIIRERINNGENAGQIADEYGFKNPYKGLVKRPQRFFTDKQLLDMLKQKEEELGREPRITDILKDENMPSQTPFIKRFGSFITAKEKAGIIPSRPIPIMVSTQRKTEIYGKPDITKKQSREIPELHETIIKLEKSDKVQEYRKQYRSNPERKKVFADYMREYEKKPEIKEKKRIRRNTPEAKKRRHENYLKQKQEQEQLEKEVRAMERQDEKEEREEKKRKIRDIEELEEKRKQNKNIVFSNVSPQELDEAEYLLDVLEQPEPQEQYAEEVVEDILEEDDDDERRNQEEDR